MAMLRAMKRKIQWLLLAACVVSLTSCGLPGAVARSAGRAGYRGGWIARARPGGRGFVRFRIS